MNSEESMYVLTSQNKVGEVIKKGSPLLVKFKKNSFRIWPENCQEIKLVAISIEGSLPVTLYASTAHKLVPILMKNKIEFFIDKELTEEVNLGLI